MRNRNVYVVTKRNWMLDDGPREYLAIASSAEIAIAMVEKDLGESVVWDRGNPTTRYGPAPELTRKEAVFLLGHTYNGWMRGTNLHTEDRIIDSVELNVKGNYEFG